MTQIKRTFYISDILSHELHTPSTKRPRYPGRSHIVLIKFIKSPHPKHF